MFSGKRSRGEKGRRNGGMKRTYNYMIADGQVVPVENWQKRNRKRGMVNETEVD